MKNKYITYGIFCSYNCTMAYIFDKNLINPWEQFSLLKLLYKESNLNSNCEIKCAPPKEILKEFGGSVSIEDYRKSFICNDIEYRYLTPPIVSIISQIIEEKKHIEEKKKNVNKFNDYKIEYKLKRNKTIINSKNSLDKTMGITIN